MTNQYQVPEHSGSNLGNVVAGVLIGAAAGAAAMLLLAPQSGKATREQIRQKSIETMEQVRSSTDKLVADGRRKGEELKAGGQELLADQLGRVSSAAQAGQKAVQNS
jgi:gas vesicle protein